LAGYHETAYDIDTDRLIQDFARCLRANGGQVLTDQPVTGITRTADGWQVLTATQTYTCTRLVNAAGAWADQIATMAGIAPIGLTPLRRSMARIPAPGGHDVSGWPLFFGVGESWYAKPDAGALLVSPADEDPAEPHDAWADDMVLAEGLARYEAMVSTPVERLLTSWAGLRSFAPDRALVLGPDPDEPNFIWSAAQGGYGFQTSPAASQLVADLTFGRPPQLAEGDVAQLTPHRLRS
jgi:glycine/D-amino acid oxidase-like deaminating enzyme